MGRSAEIAARLAAAQAAAPVVDRDTIAGALITHLSRLRVDSPPLRLIADPREWRAQRGRPTATPRWRDAAHAAEQAAWSASGWPGKLARVWIDEFMWPYSALGLWQDRRGWLSAPQSPVWTASEAWGAARSATWSQAEAAAEDYLRVTLAQATGQPFPTQSQWPFLRVSWAAAAAAGWAAAPSSPEADRVVDIWLPLLDAYEAGLWQLAVMENEIAALPRPTLRDEEGRLHAEDGPALMWPGDVRCWFWRGVAVPQRVIEQPEALQAQEIAAEPNLEVRRVMLERFGADRYIRESGATLVQEDECGKLWRREFQDDEPLQMVEVVNSTAEQDGSHRHYLLRVPPDVKTAKEAVAWSFGFEPGRYNPTVET